MLEPPQPPQAWEAVRTRGVTTEWESRAAHLLDHRQDPGFCVVVTVGANSLRSQPLACCPMLQQHQWHAGEEQRRGEGRAVGSDSPDRLCLGSHRPCTPASSQRAGPRGPEGPPRRGSLLLTSTTCGLRCSGVGRWRRNGGLVVTRKTGCGEIWTPF